MYGRPRRTMGERRIDPRRASASKAPRAALWGAMVMMISCSAPPEALELAPSRTELYASGMDMTRVTITAVTESGRTARNFSGTVSLSLTGDSAVLLNSEGIVLERGEGEVILTTTLTPGEVVLSAEAEGLRGSDVSLTVKPDYRDTDNDGFADVMELFGDTDRLNFRRWLCAVAESQVYEKNRRWSDATTDCAGFVRFAYIEALKVHDETFFSGYSALASPSSPDVKKYNYPDVPLVGTAVFRAVEGRFEQSDVETGSDVFSPSATAGVLLHHNVTSLGKSDAAILPGDMLFFFNPDNPDMPYHTMIYLGEWGAEADEETGEFTGDQDWVVYHTGPRESDAGEVRKVRLSTLAAHPDERWRPVRENDHFLGYYRFRILD